MRRFPAVLALILVGGLFAGSSSALAAGGVRFSGTTCTYTGSANSYQVSISSTITTALTLGSPGAQLGTRTEVRTDNGAAAWVGALSASATGYTFALSSSPQTWSFALPPDATKIEVRDSSNNKYSKIVACKPAV